jgi:serine/threonine protein kinase
MPLTSGSKLGAYEIIAPIGAGGMGEVYRARDPELGRDVAVKILPSAFSADTDRLRRFKQEAQATAALNHPNILALYHIGQQDGSPYLVSELSKERACASAFKSARCPYGRPLIMPRRSPADLPLPTTRASSTAISSPRTSSLPRMAAQKFSISAWPS